MTKLSILYLIFLRFILVPSELCNLLQDRRFLCLWGI